MLRIAAIAGATLAAVCVAGCDDEPAPAKPKHSPAARSAPAEHRDAAVIRRWSDTLRSGDVAGAARLFAVPATVANGGAPQRLTTRAAIRGFNESLPCGARLLRTRHRSGYTVATFRLTRRRGAECGRGVGAIAATAFVVHRGRIREWLRVPAGGGRRPPPETSTS
ncbi:MAG TPA: hypothetical protein VJT75_17885 [Thermoleophilaceae bacterium]|nr:hypothetical protein [Thermoleophilaceae bacterium]